jgi:hypothetical protein
MDLNQIRRNRHSGRKNWLWKWEVLKLVPLFC